jgi:hypothetical protein
MRSGEIAPCSVLYAWNRYKYSNPQDVVAGRGWMAVSSKERSVIAMAI